MPRRKNPIKPRYKKRPLTQDTAYLVCLWTFRDGNTVHQIADILLRPERQIRDIISDCKADGRWDKFKRFWNSLNNALPQSCYYDVKCLLMKY